jgi:hypothetical protein
MTEHLMQQRSWCAGKSSMKSDGAGGGHSSAQSTLKALTERNVDASIELG